MAQPSHGSRFSQVIYLVAVMNDQRLEDDYKHQTIHRRLVLAKDILEDSDKLPGKGGTTVDGSAYLKHPRHDREALVIYLLLTCFDLLGQPAERKTFAEWLESRKAEHMGQRDRAISNLIGSESFVEVSLLLAKAYDLHFGVKNSFYKGVLGLPQPSKHRLLSSIHFFEDKNWKLRSANTSEGAVPLEKSAEDMEKLRLNYLYQKRNRFTHSLEQQDYLSAPNQSLLGLGLFDEHRQIAMDVGASWIASLTSEGISYHCQFNDKIRGKNSLLVKVRDWPFALFEALHEAIGVPFERTSIDLKFQVYQETDRPCHPTWPSVSHASLPSLLIQRLV
jgi:hypothetical protein